jgi:hypothetical protein
MAFPTLVLALQGAAQLAVADPRPGVAPAVPPRASTVEAAAVYAERAPVIDGKDDDPVWARAQVIDAFRQHEPVIDGDPSFRTEARVAHDERYLYVFVRAFDPEPRRIMALLSRRDVRTQSDYIHVFVDSYKDRRTGWRFTVNPLGVQTDVYTHSDGIEDRSWDGVWTAETRVDSLGWTAEFRLPLSQLRFAPAEVNEFGFAVWRDVGRTSERMSWPLYRRDRTGFVSQMGTLTNLRGLGSPRRVELLPYVVEKNASHRGAGDERFSRADRVTAGLDLKYGLTSNLTLDATVNPDFGQVEADPAALNLSAFELFFAERRPFFLEGMGIFNFEVDCNDNSCTGPFYSRRIGRPPQLSGLYADPTNPTQSIILGAAKITGRTARGLSVGIIDAVTRRELGSRERTIEPQSNYFIARLQQDLRNGNSGVGVIATATNRRNDGFTAPYLRGEAYTLGGDVRHRFGGNNYQASAFVLASRVAGTPEAMLLTQRSAVHNYQRPDAGLDLDSALTDLGGVAGQVGLNKTGGGVTRFWTGVWFKTPGFEMNDLGFQQRADELGWSNWVGLQFNKPTAWYRRAQLNFNGGQVWTLSDRLPFSGWGNVNGWSELANQMNVNAGIGWNNAWGTTYCDRCARGGPMTIRNPGLNVWAGWSGDRRQPVIPRVNASGWRRDEGRSYGGTVSTGAQWRLASRIQGDVSAGYSRNTDDLQWIGNFSSVDGTAYTFARLRQTTTSVTTRFDYTMTRTLSLQFYAQPFISSGAYSDWRAMSATPRAADYDARLAPYRDDASVNDFNFKQLRTNAVVRWEYRPGSTLFVVWQQGRDQSELNPGTFSLARDYGDLFAARPNNTFLVKASYWFGR